MKRTFLMIAAMAITTFTISQVLRPGVYIEEIPSGINPIEMTSTNVAIFIGHTQKGVRRTKRIRSMGEYRRYFGKYSADFFMYESVSLFFDNGGGECLIVSAGSFTANPSRKSLLDGLAKSKQLSGQIVIIPDAVLLPEDDFYDVQNALLQSCEEIGDRFAILCTMQPTGETIPFITNFRNEINPSSYGAVYYPWVVKNKKTIPPVGAIAGIYARTDNERGVWKAPANTSVRGITGLSESITNREQDLMNVDPDEGKSINAIRFFTGKGNLVWGARTLAGNDNEWRYVPVRRFANMIETSIKEGLNWVVFEPNDEPLWNQTRTSVENFLNEMWRNGALQGSRPENAFYVKCGLNETMTQKDIDQGRMIVEIGMAVVRPAEFIILKFEFKVQ